MRKFLRANRTLLALCLNAVILLAILLAVTTRDGRILPQTLAFGQMPPQSAPLNGLTVMPAQLSPNTWGCYLMDTEHQTLSVYQFYPQSGLTLAASRDFRYDRQLGFFNTNPAPADVKAMVERAAQPARTAQPVPVEPETKP